MSDTDEKQMELYGIIAEQRTIFCYKSYRYDSLEAALNYAKIDAARQQIPDKTHRRVSR